MSHSEWGWVAPWVQRLLTAVCLWGAALALIAAAEPQAPVLTVAELEGVMRQRGEVDFVDRPLHEIVDELAEELGVPVYLDEAALKDAGVDRTSPMTFRCAGPRWSSIFNALLEPMDMDWDYRHGAICVTSKESCDIHEYSVVYPAEDLVTRGGGEPDYESVIELIMSTLSPQAWKEGNVRQIDRFNGALVILQSRRFHEQIAALFSELRRVLKDPTSKRTDEPLLERIEETLDQPFALPKDEMTLESLVSYVRKECDVPVLLAPQLEFHEVPVDLPLKTKRASGRLRDVLGRVLGAHGLAFAVQPRFEAITITTPDHQQAIYDVRVYPIPRFETRQRPGSEEAEVIETMAHTDEFGYITVERFHDVLVIDAPLSKHEEIERIIARLADFPPLPADLEVVKEQPLSTKAYAIHDVSLAAIEPQVRRCSPRAWSDRSRDGRGTLERLSTAESKAPSGGFTGGNEQQKDAAAEPPRPGLNGWLIIRQSAEVHEKIERLLTALRVLADCVELPTD